jgi:hypothetical protein
MTKVYLLCLTVIVLSACKSAVKSYNKGDYTEALTIGIQKLKKKPSDGEALEIVKNAYTLAHKGHEEQIRLLSVSNDVSNYERILSEYQKMQDLYIKTSGFHVTANLVNPVDYSKKIVEYREKVTVVHVELANEALKNGDKRKAYYEMKKALQFSNDAKLQKRKDSIYMSTATKIVLSPLQTSAGNSSNFSSQLQNFQNDILNSLTNNKPNYFIVFYSEGDARNQNIAPDQYLELNLSRIQLGNITETKSSRDVSQDVVVKETVHKPDSVTKEYAKVKGKITTTNRTQTSEADIIVYIRDNKKQEIWKTNLSSRYNWSHQFTTFAGDEKALTEEDKKTIKGEDRSPTESVLVHEVLQQIKGQVVEKIRQYYAQ